MIQADSYFNDAHCRNQRAFCSVRTSVITALKNFGRFTMLVYSPMLVLLVLLTPIMALMFQDAIDRNSPTERFDVGYFFLSFPLMYVSMSIVRRAKSELACFFSIYPFVLWFWFYFLYLVSSAASGFTTDGHPDPLQVWQSGLTLAAHAFLFLWPVLLVMAIACRDTARNAFWHVNTVTRQLEW